MKRMNRNLVKNIDDVQAYDREYFQQNPDKFEYTRLAFPVERDVSQMIATGDKFYRYDENRNKVQVPSEEILSEKILSPDEEEPEPFTLVVNLEDGFRQRFRVNSRFTTTKNLLGMNGQSLYSVMTQFSSPKERVDKALRLVKDGLHIPYSVPNPQPTPLNPVIGELRLAPVTNGQVGEFSPPIFWQISSFLKLLASSEAQAYRFVTFEGKRVEITIDQITAYMRWLGIAWEFDAMGVTATDSEMNLAQKIISSAWQAKRHKILNQSIIKFDQPGLAYAEVGTNPEEEAPNQVIEFYATYTVEHIKWIVLFPLSITVIDDIPIISHSLALEKPLRNRLILIAAALIRDFWVSDIRKYDSNFKTHLPPRRRKGRRKRKRQVPKPKTHIFTPSFALNFAKPINTGDKVLSQMENQSQSALQLLFG